MFCFVRRHSQIQHAGVYLILFRRPVSQMSPSSGEFNLASFIPLGKTAISVPTTTSHCFTAVSKSIIVNCGNHLNHIYGPSSMNNSNDSCTVDEGTAEYIHTIDMKSSWSALSSIFSGSTNSQPTDGSVVIKMSQWGNQCLSAKKWPLSCLIKGPSMYVST